MAHRYAPVDQCIYCGTVKLAPGEPRFGDEHIVPFALNGALILPRASCQVCAGIINREIESHMICEEWDSFRVKHGLPTRRPKKRRNTVSLGSKTGGRIRIPAQEYTAPTPLYEFKVASILSGKRVPNRLSWTMSVLVDGNEETRLQRRYPLWDRKHCIKPQPYGFARLIAKIAYSYAAAEIRLLRFEPLVRDIILGRSDDYFRFVGSAPESSSSEWSHDGRHQFGITMHYVRGVGLIVVEIKLFSVESTPVYHCVVGEIATETLQQLLSDGEAGIVRGADVPAWKFACYKPSREGNFAFR